MDELCREAIQRRGASFSEYAMPRPNFEWNDSFTTGEPSIDLQHRYLIRIINELGSAIDQGKGEAALREILVATQFYAEWHFAREETCMERYRCPAAARNKQAHVLFIEKFKVLRGEFEQDGASTTLADRIYTELTEWLVNHILKVDTALASVVPPRPRDKD